MGPVSLRLMMSQFKYIVTEMQKYRTVKCIFCCVWVPNFVWNFKRALWNFTQNLEPIHHKICILRGVKNLTTYDILESFTGTKFSVSCSGLNGMIGYHGGIYSLALSFWKEPILHNQHHVFWWPGATRRQVISRHGLDLVHTVCSRIFHHPYSWYWKKEQHFP